MKILRKLLTRLSKVPSWVAIAILALAILGFLDASYLTVKFYVGGPIPCGIFDGCDTVAASPYAKVGPFPLAIFGAIYYFVIIIMAVAYFDRRDSRIMNILSYFVILGFVFSLWLVYLQIFVIKALCIYCIFSAATSTTLFGVGQYISKFRESHT